MRIRTKAFLIFFSISMIPLILAGSLMYAGARKQLSDSVQQNLSSIVSLQESRIIELFERFNSNAQSIASRTQLRISAQSYLNIPSVAEQNRMNTILLDARNSISDFKEVSLISPTGTIIASTNQSKLNKELFPEIANQTIPVSPQFYAITTDEKNNNQIQLLGKLFRNSEHIGYLEVIADIAPLSSITMDSIGLGETGEITIATRDIREDAEFITPLKYEKESGIKKVISKDNITSPTIIALTGQEEVLGSNDAIDYRGELVFAATKYIDQFGWGLVAKIDQEEVLGSLSQLFSSFIVIVIVNFLLVGLIVYFVSKRMTSPIRTLTQYALKFQSGKFHKSIPVDSKDEVGQLARAFESMGARLSQLYGHLEDIVDQKTGELSTALNQQQEQTQLLQKAKTATLNVLEDLEDEREELAKANAKDEAMLASIGEGLIAIDPEGKITLVNHAFEMMIGKKLEDVQGKSLFRVLPVLNEDGKPLPKAERPMTHTLEEKVTTVIASSQDKYYKRADGTLFPITITSSPILVGDKLVGAIEVFRDITQQKAVDRAKTEFVSLASHQLKTPITSFQWNLELLNDPSTGKLNKMQKQLVETLAETSHNMRDLVNALLNTSRIDLGVFSIERKPVNLSHVADKALGELKEMISRKELEITKDYAADLPIIQADPDIILVTFQNILSNAVKYTPEQGQVSITIHQVDESVRIAIKDTGLGIPKEEQKHIFQKLYRASNVEKENIEGTGLGLYIVKSAIEAGGGKIWFESEANKGTTFYIQIPLSGMKEKVGSRKIHESS